MILHKKLVTDIKYNNVTYSLKPYFNNVLSCFWIMKQIGIDEESKFDLCLSRLVIENKSIKKLHFLDKAMLFKKIMDLLIDSKKNDTTNKKTFDFIQDAEYIYSAFFECYKIDLYEQFNKLHWQKFIALFKGLNDTTRFMKIVAIRAQPIPKPNKYNGEEIARLIESKQLHSLEISQEEREEQLAKGLNNLFDALIKAGG